jgi:hypothetical protein
VPVKVAKRRMRIVPLLAPAAAVGLAATSVEPAGFLLARRRPRPTRAHPNVTLKELA